MGRELCDGCWNLVIYLVFYMILTGGGASTRIMGSVNPITLVQPYICPKKFIEYIWTINMKPNNLKITKIPNP